jgi:DNA-binding NarL/FixJ family response regulator/predicted transcriptional regulator
VTQRLAAIVFVEVEASARLRAGVGNHHNGVSEPTLGVVRDRAGVYGGRLVRAVDHEAMLVFESPRSAVAFAVAVQQAVAGREVRIGINFGETSGGNRGPTGAAVAAAARIAEKAEGGQIVVSEVVRTLVGTTPGIRFAEHGRTKLKGSAEPWQLYRVGSAAQTSSAEPVFGREVELRRIDQLIAAVVEGSGWVLLFEGEAGIGKSHLARAAMSRARTVGAMVGSGGADEFEQQRPTRILASICAGLGVAFDDLWRPATDAEGPLIDPAYTVVERFVDAVEHVAVARPLLLVVEDLHWATELSLRAIGSIVRRIGALPIGVVATLRPTPRPPRLHRFLEVCERTGGDALYLAGLDAAAVANLVASRTGAALGEALRERLEAAAGNPLFVTELLQALDDEGALRIQAGVVETDATSVPAGLASTVTQRVAALAPDDVELLRLASLLGSEFRLDELATVAGRAVVDVAGSLREAVDAGLISGQGNELVFRHDLVRQAVYADVPPAIRTDLHLAAGRALAAAGASAPKVARHFAFGSRPGDLVAVEWLLRASRETVHLDTAAATSFSKQALSLAPPDWPQRAEVESTLVELLAWAGHLEEAQGLAESLLDRSLSPADELLARRAFAAALSTDGQLASAVEHLQRSVALPNAGPVEQAILRCAAAGMSVIAAIGTPTEAEEVAAPFLETHDPTLACWAHHTMAVAAVAAGAYDDQLRHARTARNLLDHTYVPPLGFLIPHAWVATALYHLDDPHGAEEAVAAARRRAEERGDVGLLMHAIAATAALHFMYGAFDDAVSEAETGLALADETDDNVQRLLLHAVAALVALDRGDLSGAEGHISAGETFYAAGSRHPFGIDLLVSARASLLEITGEPERARMALHTVWQRTTNLRGLIQWRYLGPDLIRLSVAAGDLDHARTVATDMEQLAGQSSSRSGAAAALRARGLAEQDPDRLVAAAEAYLQTHNLPEIVAACEDATTRLLDSGREEEAAKLLKNAATIHLRTNATHRLARVEALLREAGVHLERPRRAPATHGWEALSQRELEIVGLVTEGLSNPQIAAQLFISRRTVETHLSNVYRKLDLTNRTQLATVALATGSKPPAQVVSGRA